MLNVSENTIKAYNSDACLKSLRVVFPELNIEYTNNQIIEESLKLKESILESDSLEFVGCISSYMSVQIYGMAENVKGKFVEVYVIDNSTLEEIPLFHGIVESAVQKGYEGIKTIEAYDVMYHLGEIDVTDWYNRHIQCTVQKLLEELAQKCGIEISNRIELPNGNITAFCGKTKETSQLSALALLKHICQINGGFGRINRSGKFELVFLAEPLAEKKYPSNYIYPSIDIFPNMPGTVEPPVQLDLTFPFYQKMEFEEYNVNPINKVVIRDFDSAEGVFYGNGTNKYIIQGNLFAFGQSKITLQQIGGKIYHKVQGISFTPFTSKNYGLPFVECGDNVFYKDLVDGDEIKRSFFVFSRTLTGIQCMNDSYKAKGQENQSEFITDLGSKIESIKDENDAEKEEKENEINDLKKRVARLEAIIGSFSTVTGLIIDKPIVENTRTAVVTDTVVSLEDNNNE